MGIIVCIDSANVFISIVYGTLQMFLKWIYEVFISQCITLNREH